MRVSKRQGVASGGVVGLGAETEDKGKVKKGSADTKSMKTNYNTEHHNKE